jgi:UDP-N-acetylmuramate-alanine ligase
MSSNVIHSAAYSADSNPELAEALRRGLPVLKYTEVSVRFPAVSILRE